MQLLAYKIHQRFDKLTSDESIFLFLQSFFWRKVHLISFFFVLYIVFQLRYFWWSYFLNIFSVLDTLLRLVCLRTSSSTCNNTNSLYIIFTCCINQFLLLNTFSFHFSQTLLSTQFLFLLTLNLLSGHSVIL